MCYSVFRAVLYLSADNLQQSLSKYYVIRHCFVWQNIFVTGGCASFPNFVDRLSRELRAIRPFESEFCVTAASDVVLDAWHGARWWATTSALTDSSITLAEYNEKGGEYLKEHSASNRCVSASGIYAGKQWPIHVQLWTTCSLIYIDQVFLFRAWVN